MLAKEIEIRISMKKIKESEINEKDSKIKVISYVLNKN